MKPRATPATVSRVLERPRVLGRTCVAAPAVSCAAASIVVVPRTRVLCWYGRGVLPAHCHPYLLMMTLVVHEALVRHAYLCRRSKASVSARRRPRRVRFAHHMRSLHLHLLRKCNAHWVWHSARRECTPRRREVERRRRVCVRRAPSSREKRGLCRYHEWTLLSVHCSLCQSRVEAVLGVRLHVLCGCGI